MSQCDCAQFAIGGSSGSIGGHHENCSRVAHLVPKFRRLKAVWPNYIWSEKYWHLEQNGKLVLHGEFTDEEKAALHRVAQE